MSDEEPKGLKRCPKCGKELIRTIDAEFGYIESCSCGYEHEKVFK